MCSTCGCGQPENEITITVPGAETGPTAGHEHTHVHGDETYTHSHDHDADHPHDHDEGHFHEHRKEILVEQDILRKNNLMAERNRGYFEGSGIVALNLVSSPGSGKTLLLERTLRDVKDLSYSIIEGDQQTMNDAMRIKETGAPVVQINTGTGCHLDAEMINHAVKVLKPAPHSLLFIENVGNLVCPALFDLGENYRIVIMSVTEGDDKPLKYPTMFRTSHMCIINKVDLLPYVDFDMVKARSYAVQVNPHLQFFEVSAKSGQGLETWYEWLKGLMEK
jgi:hydrogenase nickel incorporation protein HypB